MALASVIEALLEACEAMLEIELFSSTIVLPHS